MGMLSVFVTALAIGLIPSLHGSIRVERLAVLSPPSAIKCHLVSGLPDNNPRAIPYAPAIIGKNMYASLDLFQTSVVISLHFEKRKSTSLFLCVMNLPHVLVSLSTGSVLGDLLLAFSSPSAQIFANLAALQLHSKSKA